MAREPQRGIKAEVKAPLIIAAVLAVLAFFGVLIFATGGTGNTPEFRLALSAAGGVFIVTLVVCATLIIVEKPNDEELGEGTGVNRRTSDLYAEARARREQKAREQAETSGSEQSNTKKAGSGADHSDDAAGTSSDRTDAGPRFGERAHPDRFN